MTPGSIDLQALVRTAGRYLYPEQGFRSQVRRTQFWLASRQHLSVVERLLHADTHGRFARALLARPHVLGMFVWPYINCRWDVEQRFKRFSGHYESLDDHPALDLAVDDQRRLAELGDIYPGLRLILDRPQWFLREGELSLNLFVENERIYSLAFSLGREGGHDVIFVGNIQGRDIDGVELLYKALTKSLHGARPRDFLIGALQLFCEVEGIERILAVSEAARHHRHEFFGGKVTRIVSANYDTIWSERGGMPLEQGFHDLPPRLMTRCAAEVPPAKRAQYRYRYRLYDRLRAAFSSQLAAAGGVVPAAETVC